MTQVQWVVWVQKLRLVFKTHYNHTGDIFETQKCLEKRLEWGRRSGKKSPKLVLMRKKKRNIWLEFCLKFSHFAQRSLELLGTMNSGGCLEESLEWCKKCLIKTQTFCGPRQNPRHFSLLWHGHLWTWEFLFVKCPPIAHLDIHKNSTKEKYTNDQLENCSGLHTYSTFPTAVEIDPKLSCVVSHVVYWRFDPRKAILESRVKFLIIVFDRISFSKALEGLF